jgi:hypothetical protein
MFNKCNCFVTFSKEENETKKLDNIKSLSTPIKKGGVSDSNSKIYVHSIEIFVNFLISLLCNPLFPSAHLLLFLFSKGLVNSLQNVDNFSLSSSFYTYRKTSFIHLLKQICVHIYSLHNISFFYSDMILKKGFDKINERVVNEKKLIKMLGMEKQSTLTTSNYSQYNAEVCKNIIKNESIDIEDKYAIDQMVIVEDQHNESSTLNKNLFSVVQRNSFCGNCGEYVNLDERNEKIKLTYFKCHICDCSLHLRCVGISSDSKFQFFSNLLYSLEKINDKEDIKKEKKETAENVKEEESVFLLNYEVCENIDKNLDLIDKNTNFASKKEKLYVFCDGCIFMYFRTHSFFDFNYDDVSTSREMPSHDLICKESFVEYQPLFMAYFIILLQFFITFSLTKSHKLLLETSELSMLSGSSHTNNLSNLFNPKNLLRTNQSDNSDNSIISFSFVLSELFGICSDSDFSQFCSYFLPSCLSCLSSDNSINLCLSALSYFLSFLNIYFSSFEYPPSLFCWIKKLFDFVNLNKIDMFFDNDIHTHSVINSTLHIGTLPAHKSYLFDSLTSSGKISYHFPVSSICEENNISLIDSVDEESKSEVFNYSFTSLKSESSLSSHFLSSNMFPLEIRPFPDFLFLYPPLYSFGFLMENSSGCSLSRLYFCTMFSNYSSPLLKLLRTVIPSLLELAKVFIYFFCIYFFLILRIQTLKLEKM